MQCIQHPGELLCVTPVLAQLPSPVVDGAHFWSSNTLSGCQGGAQGDLQCEFLPRALSHVRQGLQQLQSRGKVANRLRMRRPLYRLLPGELKVLHRLRRVSTPTIVMSQLTVVLVPGGAVEGFHGVRRAFM